MWQHLFLFVTDVKRAVELLEKLQKSKYRE